MFSNQIYNLYCVNVLNMRCKKFGKQEMYLMKSYRELLSFVPSVTNEQQEHLVLLYFFMPDKCLFDIRLTEHAILVHISRVNLEEHGAKVDTVR